MIRQHLAGIVGFALATMPAASIAQNTEEKAARAAIQQYLDAHARADSQLMRNAFLPTAHIEGIRETGFTSWTVQEYSARFDGRPAADETLRRRTIDHVIVSGTAGSASATLVHGATTFTDYFVLLKVNGAWKIANKVYSSRPTSR